MLSTATAYENYSLDRETEDEAEAERELPPLPSYIGTRVDDDDEISSAPPQDLHLKSDHEAIVRLQSTDELVSEDDENQHGMPIRKQSIQPTLSVYFENSSKAPQVTFQATIEAISRLQRPSSSTKSRRYPLKVYFFGVTIFVVLLASFITLMVFTADDDATAGSEPDHN